MPKKMASSSQASIDGRGKPLNVRRQNSCRDITERLASRVKGLRGVDERLRCPVINSPGSKQRQKLRTVAAKKRLIAAHAWILRNGRERKAPTSQKPGW